MRRHWDFSYFTSGQPGTVNPGRQLYEKSVAKSCYLSEYTCSVKGKFNFCIKTSKHIPLPFSSLFCLLWRFRTQHLESQGAQRLPFQKEFRVYELCIFMFLSFSAAENSSNECVDTLAIFVELGGFPFSCSLCRIASYHTRRFSPLKLNHHLYVEVFNITQKIFKGLSKSSS